jgi:hypothetical protein
MQDAGPDVASRWLSSGLGDGQRQQHNAGQDELAFNATQITDPLRVKEGQTPLEVFRLA